MQKILKLKIAHKQLATCIVPCGLVVSKPAMIFTSGSRPTEV